MPKKLIDYKLFKESFDDIKRIARETGEFKKVAEFLEISVHALRDWRKKYPELENVIQNGFKDCPLLIKYEKSYFFDKHLENIEKIAIETGEIKKIAKFLGITPHTLRVYRKKYSSLNKVIQDGLAKYRPYTQKQLETVRKLDKTHEKEDIAEFLGVNSHTLYTYCKRYPELKDLRKGHLKRINQETLTTKVLNDIRNIIKTGHKKDVAKYLNIRRETLKKYCKIYPQLNQAIESGLSYRNKNVHMGRKVKPDLIEYNLYQIEKIIEKTGKVKSAPQILNISINTFKDIRRKYTELEAAVKRGKLKYKANKQVEKLSKNKEKDVEEKPIELFRFKKPKKELVVEVDSIDDNMEDALARYRKMKEAEKEAMSRKELKNIDIL